MYVNVCLLAITYVSKRIKLYIYIYINVYEKDTSVLRYIAIHCYKATYQPMF